MATRRDGPRISINKLGEYMVANPLRRRAIVKDQKYPNPSIVTWYTDARPAMVQHLASQSASFGEIDAAIAAIRASNPTSPHRENDANLSIAALGAYKGLPTCLAKEGIFATAGENAPSKLSIGGIDISVRPDVLLRVSGPRGRESLGAVKLVLAKETAVNAEAGVFIATVTSRWLMEQISEQERAGGTTVSHEHCYVVDVFRQACFHANRSFKQRMNQIGCRSSQWIDLPINIKNLAQV